MEQEYISLKKTEEILTKKKKPYSRAYLSLLARQGKLKAVKIGVEWMTTKNWLNQFLGNRKKSKRLKWQFKHSEVILPLYFGYGLKIALVKLSNDTLNLTSKVFKKHWQEAVALVLLVVMVSSGFWFYPTRTVLGATYYFVQTDWSGGLDGETYPVHPTNKTNWTKYNAKDSETIASTELALTTTSDSWTQTSSADFNAGTPNSVSINEGDVILAAESFSWSAKSAWDTPDIGEYSVPAFADLDNDGDYDLLIGEKNGINYGYENTGSITSPTWSAKSAWDVSDDEVNVAPAFADLDNDSDYDLLIGEYYGVSYGYENTGSITSPTWSAKSAWDTPDVGTWSRPVFADLDNDSDYDLLIGEYYGVSFGYENTGSITSPTWSAKSAWDTPDIGEYSVPSFADLDNDGDYDLLIGEYYGVSFGYENTGSITSPTWSAKSAWDTPDIGSSAAPAFADLDNDGDYDLLIGEAGGVSFGYENAITYYSPGDLISSSQDLGQQSNFTTIQWTENLPSNTDLKFQIATNNDNATWNFIGPGGTDATYYTTASGENIHSSHNEDQYVKYKAYLSTSDTSVTPTLSDITINYEYYPSSASLTSSPYDTSDAANALSDIQWTESLASNTNIKFQMRTAPDSSGSPDWANGSGWCGPSTCAATKADDDYASDYYETTSAGETANSVHSTGENDQWFQYKVWLVTTDNVSFPTLSDVTLTYVVNAPPEFNPDYPSPSAGGVSAVQNSDGTVTINYSIRDPDTTSGSSTPGYITPSFEYWNDSSWVSCTTMASGDTDNKAVEEVNYIAYSATWYAKTDFNSQYMNNTAKIKITINDNEAANNTANQESATFTLDTKDPVPGTPSISVDPSQSPAALTISCSDDLQSTLQMKIGLASDLSDATYEDYSTSSTISLVTDPDTVYIQFKDEKGNTSSIVSATTPETPSSMIIRDVTNLDTSDFQLFIAWKVIEVPSPGFQQYIIFRSTDGTNYAQLTTIDNRLLNYYMDTSLSSSNTYYYKISSQDSNNNISYYSSVVSDVPNGQGGTDTTSPTISNIADSALTTNSVTITWTTDELSNSYVDHNTTPSVDGLVAQGVLTMTESHSVTTTGLNPGTTYYYRVRSVDPSGNEGTDDNSGSYYTFNTTAGPIISNVSTIEVTNNTAKINWTTNVSANSYVVYSTNSDMSDFSEYGTTDLTTAHSVTISSLTQGTKYYYYVKSTDSESNTAYDKNVVDGAINYYNFTTTSDSTGPVISNVTAAIVNDTGATITWTTNENATSQVIYGTSTSYGSETTEDTTLTLQHSVTLSSLTKATTYYYKVISKDASDNQAEDDNSGNSYSFTTTNEPGETVYVGGGGGGGCSTDRKAPIISNIIVSDITFSSVTISWNTNEKADAFVEYGETTDYGRIVGDPEESNKNHSVNISSLSSGTTYHFKILGKDSSGNLGYSEDQTFAALGTKTEFIEEVPEEEKGLVEKAIDILKTLSNPHSLSSVSSALEESASRVIGAPLIVGEYPKVEIGSDWAKISWVTDKKANSLVAYASEEEYDSLKDEPYVIVSGDPDEMTTIHIIKLNNLKPSTLYHYQVRSKATFGDLAKSEDKTFTTLGLKQEISDITLGEITDFTATLSWNTTIPTQTLIEYTNTRTNQTETKKDPYFVRDHRSTLTELEARTAYTLKIKAKDEKGKEIVSPILTFSTGDDIEPPEISQTRTETALSSKGDRVQCIISWLTNEPSTTQVFYQKGVMPAEEMSFTPKDNTLTKKHIVVITNFSPGTVYRFYVESEDFSENKAKSKDYTILTSQRRESIIQMIIRNFEQSFSWMKQMRF
ncbi:fibronectin type III domain-containing protein [Candidatus Parcubacteria bacterium]|nr:fibronectin type III domain-containing protein [Candidatus Parcubacteria bacterium]